MKNIFKYELKLIDIQEVLLPKWSTPLSVQMQNGKIQMWVFVDPDQPTIKANVIIHGTGQDIPDNFYVGREHNLFLGTVQEDVYVWHIFIAGSFIHQS